MSEEYTATRTMAEGFKTINDLLTDAKASVDDTYLYGTLLLAKKLFRVRIYNNMSPYHLSKKGRHDTKCASTLHVFFSKKDLGP